MDNLEKERDFYFGKLRDIEIIVQLHESGEAVLELPVLLEQIKKILYSTEVN